nr:MAG TPA: hypothetical protein [Microviridae sp.]
MSEEKKEKTCSFLPTSQDVVLQHARQGVLRYRCNVGRKKRKNMFFFTD